MVFYEKEKNVIKFPMFDIKKQGNLYWCLSNFMLVCYDIDNNKIIDHMWIEREEWHTVTKADLVCTEEKIYCFNVKSEKIILYNSITKKKSIISYKYNNEENQPYAYLFRDKNNIWMLPRNVKMPFARIDIISDEIFYYEEWNERLLKRIPEIKDSQLVFINSGIVKDNVLWSIVYNNCYIVKTNLITLDLEVIKIHENKRLQNIYEIQDKIYCFAQGGKIIAINEKNEGKDLDNIINADVFVHNNIIFLIDNDNKIVYAKNKNDKYEKKVEFNIQKNDSIISKKICGCNLIISTFKENIIIYGNDNKCKRVNALLYENTFRNIRDLERKSIYKLHECTLETYCDYIKEISEKQQFDCSMQSAQWELIK